MGRRPVLRNGRMSSEVSPSARGFRSVSISEGVCDRLQEYMQLHGLRHKSAAVEHLLSHIGSQDPPRVELGPVPWERIEEALWETFGARQGEVVQKALSAVKTAWQ